MADPVTTNKGLTIPATGADPNAWGPILNGNFALVDAFLGTTSSLVLSSGTVTLNAAQAQAVRISCTGTLTGAVTITIPQKAGYFYFHDQTTRGGYTITVSTGSTTGRTQNLPAKMCHLYTDGTNVWRVNEPDHGEVKDFSGTVAPPLWQLAYGQAVSRTAYVDLFNALTIQFTGSTTSGSTTVSSVTVPATLTVGQPISGPGIASGSTITAIGTTTLTLSAAATATATNVALVVAPFGIGDGSTTFNLPDYRGRSGFGADAMGGTAASRLTTESLGVAASLAASGGNELLQSHNHVLTDTGHNHTQNPHGHGVADGGHTHGASDRGHGHSDAGHIHAYTYAGAFYQGLTNPGGGGWTFTSSQNVGTGYANIQTGYANIVVNSATTGITVAETTATNNSATTGITLSAAGAGASQNIPPTLVVNKIIYMGQ